MAEEDLTEVQKREFKTIGKHHFLEAKRKYARLLQRIGTPTEEIATELNVSESSVLSLLKDS